MKKNYTPEFKSKIVMELLREEQTTSQIASKYGIHPTLLNKWKKSATEGLPELLSDRRKRDNVLAEKDELIQLLYGQIGELSTKLSWLKKKSGIDI
jgi:putative transposase